MPEFLLHGRVELREGAQRPRAVPDILKNNSPVSGGQPEETEGALAAGRGERGGEPRPRWGEGAPGGATCTAALISRSNLTISWWQTRTGTQAAAAILRAEAPAPAPPAPPAGAAEGTTRPPSSP